ncbi:MAG: histidine kinase [Paludibaculum sp.]
MLPIRISLLQPLSRWLAADAIAGAVLALMVGAWIQRDAREKHLLAEASQAQAKALQAQIEPHFFFNTMNTVQSLIDTDATEAKRVIGRLSGMFRYALAAGQAGTVPIADELRFIRDYLEIEKVRFGSRLQFHLPEAVEPFSIPALSLQPLVENAVRHGVAPAGSRAEK